MKRLLIACLNLFLLFNSVNYQIINAEEPSTDNTDNTSLITEENDTNSSNEENNIQENDSTNESDELTINDLSGDESISTIASSSTQSLYITELNTLLKNINVTDLYFGLRSDYPAVDFSTYTKYNLKNNYELYYYLDSSTGLSEAYVISDDDTQIVFPESCSIMFAKLTTLKQIHFDNINTEHVTNMHGIFADCNNLTYVDISKLNTINVKDMSYMFANCSNISSIDLSNLNTENVTDMNHMFSGCTNLISLDVSNITTPKVTNMSYMFTNCSNLPSIKLSNFNTENVTDMSRMFWGCKSLTSLDLSNFKTANVTNMCWMFTDCSNLSYVNISTFNTENVTNLDHMFYNCVNLSTVDVSNFNTEKVTNMLGMFSNCQNLTFIDVSKFNTENVTNMSWMFASCGKLSSLDVSNFNTEKVTNMEGMFSSLNVNTLDLSSFKTANVTNMGRMFFNCKSLSTIYATKDFVAPSNSENMFYSCNRLKGEKDTNYSSNKAHGEYARIDGDADSPGYFSLKPPIKPTLNITDSYTYNGFEQTATVAGFEQTATVAGFDSTTMKIEGNVQTNAGTYTITVTPIKRWSDGTTDSLTIQWVIEKATATVPDELKASQGEKLSDIPLPEGWSWNEPDTLLSAGDSQIFKASYTPSDPLNYNESINVDLTVDVELAPDKPTLSNDTYTYNGSEQSVVLTAFENSTMVIEGTNMATVVGSYTVTVKSKNGKWSDGTKEPVTFNWFIVKANPSYTLLNGLKAVQGDMLSDVTLPNGWKWNTPDSQLTDAGSNTYKATFTPIDTDNYNVLTDIDVTVNVEAAPIKPTNNTLNKKSNGWDDGGPFTTDKCGNVFDRWNNKIYEANGCSVGGYNLVRTSVVD
nr:BspA family leucine-rich repeat surface protein [uncultured Blautia sp.]